MQAGVQAADFREGTYLTDIMPVNDKVSVLVHLLCVLELAAGNRSNGRVVAFLYRQRRHLTTQPARATATRTGQSFERVRIGAYLLAASWGLLTAIRRVIDESTAAVIRVFSCQCQLSAGFV